MRTAEIREFEGGEGVWSRTIYGFKISPCNRNRGDPGALSPGGLLGQWHRTPGILPPGSGIWHRGCWQPTATCNPLQVLFFTGFHQTLQWENIGPNWEFKIFSIFFNSHLLFGKKGPFWAQNMLWDALGRSLSHAEPGIKDRQCFLGKRKK